MIRYISSRFRKGAVLAILLGAALSGFSARAETSVSSWNQSREYHSEYRNVNGRYAFAWESQATVGTTTRRSSGKSSGYEPAMLPRLAANQADPGIPLSRPKKNAASRPARKPRPAHSAAVTMEGTPARQQSPAGPAANGTGTAPKPERSQPAEPNGSLFSQAIGYLQFLARLPSYLFPTVRRGT